MSRGKLNRLWRLERIAYSFMGIQVITLIIGVLFVFYLLNNAEDKINKTHDHAISTLSSTQKLLDSSFPLALAYDDLSLDTQAFHRYLELLAIDPDQSPDKIEGFIERLQTNLEQITGLSENSLDSSLLEAVEVIIDIAYEAQITAAGNEMLRLYRDTLDPMAKIMIAIKSARQETVQNNLKLSRKLISDADEVQRALTTIGSGYQHPRLQISILIGLLLIIPVLLFLLFIYQVYRRLTLLKIYAQDTARENFHLPPFIANDKTGQLAASLGFLGRRMRRLLHQSRQQAQQAECLANQDSLTGLPNRRNFKEQLEQLVFQLRSEPAAHFLLLLDLDHFKDVNDSLGHDAGDELLNNIVQRLQHALRPDDYIARMGGDEFAAILQCEPAVIDQVAERILDKVRQPIMLQHKQLHMSVSIGITLISPGTSDEELFKQADLALYSAKNSGRNKFQRFEIQLETAVTQKQQMVNDLHKGLREQQFELYYQPQFDLNTRKIIGCEALLRWHHPDRGFVSPAEFIPIAEQTGLIVSIGDWVLAEATAKAAKLKSLGIQIPIAINVSAMQLRTNDFVATYQRVLQQHGVSPELIEIEITESLLLEQKIDAQDCLTELRAMGARIAIDDFGTGYSSLSYLKKIPIDILKIDRSFIIEAASNSTDAAILKAITALSQALELEVIAEGIETDAQLQLLSEIDCDTVQGFLLAKPMPYIELEQLLFSEPLASENQEGVETSTLAGACDELCVIASASADI
ncbi:MAG: bifunctional diguanylate cyclase/phosphodiesterase [Amphritea sp.]